ncbi:hypothetical protein E5Q_05335 [Mixia osmundae IAM 14324]|uniref:Vacuolar protein sorting-associated protein 33A n=1 Tax=Mixia osmundae (strain CBS 9802 / IAM 14324 / JCM 22182 / KY 12970) TaxID=764103 RepID=G7E738_MIXOS|nr:hypothetical protein E5Q_05335 [Mixia osmundae IAM 14324]
MALRMPGSQAERDADPSIKTSSASSDQQPRRREQDGIDTGVLRQLARAELTQILDSIIGAKTLVLDPSLAGPLGLVVDVSSLKEHGVDKLFWLEAGALSQAQKNIVYLCRPQRKWTEIIADQIKAGASDTSLSASQRHTYTVLFTPRITQTCVAQLQQFGVYGNLTVRAFPLGLVPLEHDLLSLEVSGAAGYKNIFLEQDRTAVFDLANAMMTLQQAFGFAPRIVGIGEASRKLADLLFRLRNEMPVESGSIHAGALDSFVLIDRQVDMVTPLCTQLTYEGLVDECIGVRYGHVEVSANLDNNDAAAAQGIGASTSAAATLPSVNKKRKYALSNADGLFSDLRDRNFAVVGGILNRVAKRINTDYEGRHQAKTVTQIRDFVGKLSSLQAEHQSLRLHTHLTEQIMSTTMSDDFSVALEIQQNILAGLELGQQEQAIRKMIDQGHGFMSVIRLLCIYSQVNGGIKAKALEGFKRSILQAYGFEFLPFLINLERLGLLVRTIPTRSPFQQARKPLRLIVDDVDEAEPNDPAYAYSGYAPLSVRLIQSAIGGRGATIQGWKGLEDLTKVLPGPPFEAVNQAEEQARLRTPALAKRRR